MCFIDYSNIFDCESGKAVNSIQLKGCAKTTVWMCNLYCRLSEQNMWKQNGLQLLFPYGLNLYAEHSLRKVGLDLDEGGMKTGARNIKNSRYTYNNTSLAENYESLK